MADGYGLTMAVGSNIQREERLAGLLLIAAAMLALVSANSGLADAYHHLFDSRLGPVMPRFGQMSLHEWIADGLMAIFFLLVGLEVKREWYEGRLSTPGERRLPIIAATAGMVVPALIYLLVIDFDPDLIRGWAIPSATDIAFAIGVLALLGARANPILKLLLVSIAIIDDVGAVVIIALVYTTNLDVTAIAAVFAILAVMAAMNQFGVWRLSPYLAAFALLWIAMLASGIHATLAGVFAAFAIPIGHRKPTSPLRRLEHKIHPWVMFGIVPLFGFASAGVKIGSIDALLQPLPLGVLLGLFFGKQLGVFGAIWLSHRTGLARRPDHCRWLEIYGVSLLCGIGFTMSLFIGALAFPDAPHQIEAAKLGTFIGSLLSAICGWALLRFTAPPETIESDRIEAAKIFGEDQSPSPKS